MDPEDRKLLEETLELARENNQMLKKVRSVQKHAMLWSVLKWIIWIGIAFGSFYFLQPYVDRLMDLYNQVQGAQQSFNSFLKK